MPAIPGTTWRNAASAGSPTGATISRSRSAPIRRSTAGGPWHGKATSSSIVATAIEASERPARLEGGGQRAVVEIVELAADRHAMGQPGDRHVGAGQAVDEI